MSDVLADYTTPRLLGLIAGMEISQQAQGNLFVCRTALGSPQQSPGAAAAYDDTRAFISAFNGETNVAALIPAYVKLTCRTVPSTATRWEFAVTSDDGSRSAGNATVFAPVQQYNGHSRQANAATSVRIGVVTLATDANEVFHGNGVLKNAAPAIGDEFLVTFNGVYFPGAKHGGWGVVAPQKSWMFHMFGAGHDATTPGAWDAEFGFLLK